MFRTVFFLNTALQAGRSRGSIPDEVLGIFYLLNPSGRTVTLGSTQPLTEINTTCIFRRVKVVGVKN